MTRNPARLRPLAYAASLLAFLSVAAAQGGTGAAGGVSREEMWPAPTAEEWAQPCLITFQRTWADAVKTSRETGKAILVCVNMDGEPASEHYAGIRYRQADKAALYAPYVCVIASVYRHNPRDFDEEGRRILCPRFGSVTCGEHIWIEPTLYEKFLDGRRIAPRHIMVELDGKETYDVFYAMDTDSVFKAIDDGIVNREREPFPDTRGDLTLEERVGSADIDDRTMVENAYRGGDKVLRRRLLQATLRYSDLSHTDLLRLAIFGLDVELARLARQALAESTAESAIELINEALRVPMDAAEREALVVALERLGTTWPRARTLAAVHRGLAGRSHAVDADGWSTALAGEGNYAHTGDWLALEASIDYKAEIRQARPEDPSAHLDLAEATLVLAVDPETAQALAADPRTALTYGLLMFEDARRAAQAAEDLGAVGWRVNAAIGLSAYYLGDLETAYARAEVAMKGLPAGTEGWSAMATVALFAEARQKAIAKALDEKTQWPTQWLTDVNAAYSVLAKHPLGSELHVVAHYDFLRRLGARGQAARVLDEGLARFSDCAPLHDRLRGSILWNKGVRGLERAYETLLEAEDAPPNLEWFAGYASLVAAEFHRRAGDDRAATLAYDRAIGHYERAIANNAESRDSADHYIALAFAGRARVALEREEYAAALTDLLLSFERREESAASLDGLNLSPAGTAKMLLARLEATDRTELAARLQAALDALDPILLELPDFEREVQGIPRRDRIPGRRRPQRNR
ncbi:MAG: hypothetical protein E2O39_17220 [Planctomycetota bacterium]|nr:MAG: hypothetical protein E2O39_17220 [Planctomycetota bacterium]